MKIKQEDLDNAEVFTPVYEEVDELKCSKCDKPKENWYVKNRCYNCGGKLSYTKVKVITFNCPICHQKVIGSTYLEKIFTDDKVKFLANMITHMRHSHIKYWNKCWDYNGRYYRQEWFGNYDEEKKKVNEQQKRQLIRKARLFLIKNGFNVEHFKQLQNTTDETIKCAEKYLTY